MPWLVDGDNLLGCWPGRTRSDDERRLLAAQLARLGASAGRRIVIVFDGPSPLGLSPGPDTLFAGAGRSADDVILDRLRGEADPRGWTVITSDRSLGDRCRWLGARVERCDRFRGRLAPDAPGEKPERELDVEHWLERFGKD